MTFNSRGKITTDHAKSSNDEHRKSSNSLEQFRTGNRNTLNPMDAFGQFQRDNLTQMTAKQLLTDRKKSGMCTKCGIVRTHKLRKWGFVNKKTALTISGIVDRGRCINCYPKSNEESRSLDRRLLQAEIHSQSSSSSHAESASSTTTTPITDEETRLTNQQLSNDDEAVENNLMRRTSTVTEVITCMESATNFGDICLFMQDMESILRVQVAGCKIIRSKLLLENQEERVQEFVDLPERKGLESIVRALERHGHDEDLVFVVFSILAHIYLTTEITKRASIIRSRDFMVILQAVYNCIYNDSCVQKFCEITSALCVDEGLCSSIVSGGIVPCFIKMLYTDGLMADTLKQCICSLAQICSFSSKGRGQFVGQLGPEVLIELAFMHEKKHDLIAACILLATELSCDQQGSSTRIFDAIEMCSESSF